MKKFDSSKVGHLSWSLLQRQKWIVIYNVKKFIKEQVEESW